MAITTLPGNSNMSAVEFNRYDTMSYSPSNNDSLLDDRNRPNVNATPLHQQQQRLALHAVQQTSSTPSSSTLPQNVTMQQRKQELSHEMQTTCIQQQNLSHQCEQSFTQFPTSTASGTVFSSLDLAVENVMPGIYLTKNFIVWNEENLRSHGFTHIIIIDKHIQELYYPSPVFKLSTDNTTVDAFDTYEYFNHPACTSLKFGKEFEAIDLNFGEKSYLTTVLPNCYRAVKFINKAFQAGGTILVIDCNGSEQKCLTIIVAYLMYKHNINFNNAFARLKENYEKADLDRFYMTQLYEYEPILQVQRTQSRGQSCSRDMHSAILKRKQVDDDVTSGTSIIGNDTNGTTEFFSTFNPLSNFNATTQNCYKPTSTLKHYAEHSRLSQQPDISRQHQQPGIYKSSDCEAGDDYAME
ncbi:uncharacterized protein LOC128858856 isoform X2 [Anastrepha ludens]|uniref:uncharacterized protein LOC128858856 isoform X2 n=1 Tax=Anastrepha ludens TaxID=28586 RepID=UPI0023B08A0C|nr:uncharacterized protein LOC128858856 isoform X2 [Anastrepha ludens]